MSCSRAWADATVFDAETARRDAGFLVGSPTCSRFAGDAADRAEFLPYLSGWSAVGHSYGGN